MTTYHVWILKDRDLSLFPAHLHTSPFEFVDFAGDEKTEIYEVETETEDLFEIALDNDPAVYTYERQKESIDEDYDAEEVAEDARLNDLEAEIRNQEEAYQRVVESEGAQLSAALESFIASPDFKDGVISSTKAGWGGSHYSVELFPNGTFRVLWANQIGNLYETPGVILTLPQVPDEFFEEVESGEEDWGEAFDWYANEFEQELRDALVEDLDQRTAIAC